MDSLVFPAGGGQPRLESRSLPEDEVERENAILKGFLASAGRSGLLNFALRGTPTHLAERDLDFSVPTSAGEKLFELAEVYPHQGPYSTAPYTAWLHERAASLLEQIAKKCKQCLGSKVQPVHLLLYVTDFRFIPDRQLILFIQCILATVAHPFEGAYLYVALEEEHGWCCRLFPRPEENPANDVELVPT